MKKQTKILIAVVIIVVIIVILFAAFFLLKNKQNKVVTQDLTNNIDTSSLTEVESLNPLLQNVETNQDLTEGLGIRKIGMYNYTGTYKIENDSYIFGKKDEYENQYQLSIVLFEDNTVTVIPKYSTIQYLGVYYGTYSIENSILSLSLNQYKGTQQNKDTQILENVDIQVNEKFDFILNEDKTIKTNSEVLNVPKDATFNYINN